MNRPVGPSEVPLRFGEADGFGTVYDERGELILPTTEERLKGRRMLTFEAYEKSGFRRKELHSGNTAMIFLTNRRLAGVWHLESSGENRKLAGVLRSSPRLKPTAEKPAPGGPRGFFVVEASELISKKVETRHVLLSGKSKEGEFFLRFWPYGAAVTFFRYLFDKQG